MIPRTLEI